MNNKNNNKIIIVNWIENIEQEYKFYKKFFKEYSFIIAADSGLKLLYKLDIFPDILIGDLDSVDKLEIEWLKKNNIKVQKYPKNKDFTDTHLAINYALDISLKKGWKDININIIGGIGGRLDHTLGNLYLLSYIFYKNKNIEISIFTHKYKIYLLKPNLKLKIKGEKGKLLSLIPVEDLEGISLYGSHWELHNDIIKRGETRGISNFFENQEVNISIKKGLGFIIIKEDNKE